MLPQHNAGHRHVPAVGTPPRAEHEAAAGGVVGACLHADEAVLSDQRVGVGDGAGDRQRVAAGCHHRGERGVLRDHLRQPQLVERGRHGVFIEAARVGVGRVRHPQRVRGAVHLGDERGDAAADLVGDEHRDVVRGRQQDRHEGIPLGELLADADIDDRLTLAAPRPGVHDVSLTDHELRAAVRPVQWVVLEHEVGGHHLCQAGDRNRLLVRARRRPAVAEHVRRLPAPRPSVCRQEGAILVVEEVAGCRERRGGEDHGECRAEQRAPGGACWLAVGHASSQGSVMLPART